ncbi:MAG: sensor histidine kinase [Oscillospiraceae bacterium]|nr:sensor histidine kinase [Oscillospiraceae bacterium]
MIPVVAVVFNFLQWCLWVTVLNILLPRRVSVVLTWIVELAFFSVHHGLTELLLSAGASPFVRFLIGGSFIILFFCLMHRGRWYTRIAVVCGFLLVALVADIFVYYAIAGTMSQEQTLQYDFTFSQYLFNFLTNAALLSLLVLVVWRLRRNYPWEMSAPQMFLFSLFPISQLALLFRWFNVFWLGERIVSVSQLLLLFVPYLAADAALFLLIRSTAEMVALETDVRCRDEEQRSLQHQIESLLSERRRMETMEADIAGCWDEMLFLASQKNAGDLLRRAEEFQKALITTRSLPECGNRVVAGFLSRRKELLEAVGVRTEFTVSLPEFSAVSDPDLICLFGNLLDNAEEACAGVSDPVFRLRADYLAPYLRVMSENSYDRFSTVKTRRISGLDRGLGLSILQHLANKYDGDLSTSAGDKFFSVSILLKGGF